MVRYHMMRHISPRLNSDGCCRDCTDCRRSADIDQRKKRQILAIGYGQERDRGACSPYSNFLWPGAECLTPHVAQSEARPMDLLFHTQPDDDSDSDSD